MAFHENEAAMAWGYTLSAWQQETPANRARCVAHYLHRNLRDAYSSEMALGKGDKPKAGGYSAMLAGMGIKGPNQGD